MKITDEFKVGLSVVIAGVILITGLFYLKGINVFNNSRVFYAYYKNADGLKPGNSITLHGVKIGQIRDLTIDEDNDGINDGSIKVMLYIENENLNIPDDSKAIMYNENPLGTKAIKLELGSSTKPLETESVIISKEAENMMDMIKEYINPIESRAKNLTDHVDSVILTMDVVMANLETFTADLKNNFPALRRSATRALASADSLLSNVEKDVLPNVNQTLDNLNIVISDIHQMDLQKLANHIDRTIENLDGFVTKLNDSTSSVGKLTTTDELHQNLVQTNVDLQNLLTDIKNRPYKYVNVSVFEKRSFEEKQQEKESKKAYKEKSKTDSSSIN